MAQDTSRRGRPARLDPTLHALPEHLLQVVVEMIYEDSQRFVPIDRREFLSIESFPPIQPDASTLSSFRLVCKHFSELGLPYQFSRVTTRFSVEGFTRLNKISSCVRAAKCTRRFIYMVPYFFVQGHDQLRNLLERHQPRNISPSEKEKLCDRQNNQRTLLSSGADIRSLVKAFTAFTALQHVQLNPVLDTAMVHLLRFLEIGGQQGDGMAQLVQLKWAPACEHGLHSLGQALASSRSMCSKISIPAMEQESALALCSNPLPPLSAFAHHLTSLILQFVSADTQQMLDLAPYFRRFLNETTNLEAVHIGFPMAQPLDLRLEDIFHGIRWQKLKALGIQAWRLEPEEIIGIAQRHRDSLRGLRLREVLLKSGRWADVLQVLRAEMASLVWLSLRRIDYASHFDTLQAGQGFEIGDDDEDPDHQAFAIMNSDDSSSDNEDDGVDDNQGGEEESLHEGEGLASDDESSLSNEGSDHNPAADQLDLPVSADAAEETPLERSATSAHELRDNGVAVTGRQKTKAWEMWVTARDAT